MVDLRMKPRGTAGPKSVLILLAAALALAACGGGSGGGDPVDAAPMDAAPMDAAPVDAAPVDAAPVDAAPVDNGSRLRAGGPLAAATATAIATPFPSGVTQSSDRTGGATANPVFVAIENVRGRIVPSIHGRGWEFEDLPVDDGSRTLAPYGEPPLRSMTVSREYDDGSRRVVFAMTDVNRARRRRDSNAANFGNGDRDDYLIMGHWRRIPEKWFDGDGELVDFADADLAAFYSGIEYGVFANGGDPFEGDNIRALMGSASYSGAATALYADTASGKSSDLFAEAILTADFGTGADLGTIEGTLIAFRRAVRGTAESYELSDDQIGILNANPLILGPAAIGASHSGFFTGGATMVVEGVTLAGTWGGQFYENRPAPEDQPGAVAGTFGVARGQKVILGAFGARQ